MSKISEIIDLHDSDLDDREDGLKSLQFHVPIIIQKGWERNPRIMRYVQHQLVDSNARGIMGSLPNGIYVDARINPYLWARTDSLQFEIIDGTRRRAHEPN